MSLAACIRRCPSTTRWPGLRYRLFGRCASSTDGPACFACRNSGSPSSRPTSSTIRDSADAADPDDLVGDIDDPEPVEQQPPVGRERRSVPLEARAKDLPDLASSTPLAMGWSRRGTTMGGFVAIRSVPSTLSASLASACRLSRERALSRARRASARVFSSPARRTMSSASMREYQIASVAASANPAIASRYAAVAWTQARSRSFRVRPLLRPAIATLATRRCRSHSHGPGSVSSKSFRSNTSARSGEE